MQKWRRERAQNLIKNQMRSKYLSFIYAQIHMHAVRTYIHMFSMICMYDMYARVGLAYASACAVSVEYP